MDSGKRDQEVKSEKPTVIHFAAFESIQASNERHIKRLWITVIVLIALLFASNMIWLWAFTGYDMVSYDYEQGDSGINIIGDDNKEVTFNGSKAEDSENDEAQRLPGKDDASQG